MRLTRKMLRACAVGTWLCVAVALTGCATTAPRPGMDPETGAAAPVLTWEEETREAVESLRRAVEASYDRERALAERLRQTEGKNAALSQELTALQTQSAANRAQLDSLGQFPQRGSVLVAPRPGWEDQVLVAYQAALVEYRDRQYQTALDHFAEILAMAPHSDWADNAQYWRGECFYGLGRYRQALTEFTKVFAYEKTEKADDALLKVARCYLAMGEKERALAAFQQLSDEYPESEYRDSARKEMRYLQGQ
jgi:tol-pal system protein YbgF